MSYLYFPGCSLRSTGRAYEESMLSLFANLGVPLSEIDDWNCCGATAYMSVSELKSFALSARNLALAERQCKDSGTVDIVVPCAACYLGLNKAQHYLNDNPEIRTKIDTALYAAGLKYTGRARIRHPLDVLVNDIGLKEMASRTVHPLEGYRVACYYGCQLIRPYADFDDQHQPSTMDRLMKAMGAEVVDWPLKTRCCGGSLTGTVQEVGQRLSYILLKEATRRGCNVITTACPLCQFNLECYQSEMSRRFDDTVNVPVAYFTQLIGLALGIPQKKLGLQRLFVPLRESHQVNVVAGR
ncbi:MAG: CoB--CoM heterodisulfide reductase iron-sulfur subunit B family protein [candidate division Zixibacteria bacterium]|nr:CoB--CoM heterodisulfide reductase iron-sulfur subunit B family protein [candidate division Zixibacteria bacterium]MBU1469899.1 CoB--CoM heterodisulfide reductase iron-sulfur subunit B family protein [candidate division Zixibacteria bacterium]MBU2623994.1 CoB--CoM heterodisulfide reductase iron-sulfur subunit B family protein [candidate division Zixibacteria bacterium]